MRKIETPTTYANKLIKCGWRIKDFKDESGLRDELDVRTYSQLAYGAMNRLVDAVQKIGLKLSLLSDRHSILEHAMASIERGFE